MTEPTVYELSSAGRRAITLPAPDVPESDLPHQLLRDDNGLPELSQLDLMRHYLHLAHSNFGVESGFYPLGSCTMKYNPKISERLARLPQFADSHPLQDATTVQGNLALMYQLQNWLGETGGFAAVSLQPAAGAQGELAALLMLKAYHQQRGDTRRTQILIPDSAHGTNPASTSMAGLEVLQIPSNTRGTIDIDALRVACDDTVTGIMLTNPNTLGLFEDEIDQIVALVHDCGGLVYGDGANMNALTGVVRPGDLGVDIMHYNLHKTFATPHGGGGPGAGPLAASAILADFLPGPVVSTEPGEDARQPRYTLTEPTQSIGRMGTFHGNFAMFIRAYGYFRLHGAEGLKQNALHAVLNANYLRTQLHDHYPVPFDRINMHEFVCQGSIENTDIRALDISKRLLDFGCHPPTNYFPLIVPEALMIEPPETESKQTLDAFATAMQTIAAEALTTPDTLRSAPQTLAVKRLDEVQAARALILTSGQVK